jgi:decaprenylphospho-beta-D-erythro-pentofuranosid-2-ulose 2-reductase
MENAFGQPANVVVLGGTSDIAVAIVRRLLAQRARTVVLAGRDEQAMNDVLEEFATLGATATATTLFDAENPSTAGAVVADAFSRVGEPVDLVIVAVGALGDQLHDENDPVGAARMAAVNFSWPVAALSALREKLVAQGSGRIVVLSSVAALRVRRGSYLYGGAKAGLDDVCVGLADSLRGTGVTLTIVRPGFVRSKMTTGMKEPPFSTDVDTVADTVMQGLQNRKSVIFSPPLLRWVSVVIAFLPNVVWRKVDAASRG